MEDIKRYNISYQELEAAVNKEREKTISWSSEIALIEDDRELYRRAVRSIILERRSQGFISKQGFTIHSRKRFALSLLILTLIVLAIVLIATVLGESTI
jgi:hypothetical protein